MDKLREGLIAAVEKLAHARAFMAGYRDSDSCKRSALQGTVDRWIDGLDDLYDLYDESRAALAEPVADEPVALDVCLDESTSRLLRDQITPEEGEVSPIRLQVGHGHAGHGLYVSLAEYPEEGSIFLASVPTRPAPAPAERGEYPPDAVIAQCMLAVDDPLLWGRLGENNGDMARKFARAVIDADRAQRVVDLATPSGGQEAGPEEERIEASYWRFDARRNGYGEWKHAPMSERDAFKAEMRNALGAEKVRAEMRLVGRGWGPVSDADRAQRVPLTDEQIEESLRLHRLRKVPGQPSQLCDAFTAGVRFAERAHGIGAKQ